MNTATNDILAINTMRLAHDFMAAFAVDPASAIAHLEVALDGMAEWEVRQWFDYLCELLIEEESTTEIWLAMAGLCAGTGGQR